jgi:hypothetical protein
MRAKRAWKSHQHLSLDAVEKAYQEAVQGVSLLIRLFDRVQ